MTDGWLHEMIAYIAQRFGRVDVSDLPDDATFDDVDRRLSAVERDQREQAIRLRLLERQADVHGLLDND